MKKINFLLTLTVMLLFLGIFIKQFAQASPPTAPTPPVRPLVAAAESGKPMVAVEEEKPEMWKGAPDPSKAKFGAMMGLGMIDSTAGFAILGVVSRKIVERGFSPEITNDVSIELTVGPVFISGATPIAYSTHLRWNFLKDPDWTLYTVGGLGGYMGGASMGNRFALYPRFGLGVFLRTSLGFAMRGEVSHEFTTVGLSWAF